MESPRPQYFHSLRLDVSICLQYPLESEDLDSNTTEGMDFATENKAMQEKRNSFHLSCPLRKLPQEGVAQI